MFAFANSCIPHPSLTSSHPDTNPSQSVRPSTYSLSVLHPSETCSENLSLRLFRFHILTFLLSALGACLWKVVESETCYFHLFTVSSSGSLCWCLSLSLRAGRLSLTQTTHPAVRHRHPSAHVEQHVLLVQKIQGMRASGNVRLPSVDHLHHTGINLCPSFKRTFYMKLPQFRQSFSLSSVRSSLHIWVPPPIQQLLPIHHLSSNIQFLRFPSFQRHKSHSNDVKLTS